jgi:PIN domain nuclease of toxin-antitoxin system
LRLLLDTHVFLWWLGEDPRLTKRMRTAIAEPTTEVLVSAASVWEIAIKVSMGKLRIDGIDLSRADDLAPAAGFRELAISARHAAAAGALPRLHADPFDRVLVAQARVENATLVSSDPQVARYDVTLFSR